MMFWRDWACWLLVVVALGCFVVGAFPQWSDWVDPANGDKVSERRYGLWFSPSYQYVHRDLAKGGFRTEWGINWLSWSSLLMLIGFGSLGMLRSRLDKAAHQQGQEHRVQPHQ